MSVSRGNRLFQPRFQGFRPLVAMAMFGLLSMGWGASAYADNPPARLFIQVWWESPSIEMDPSEDPGRIEVYIGDVFVGCAVAPSHLNYRKQLMLVPPSIGFTGTGERSAVRLKVTGQLGALPARQLKISEI